MGKVRKAAGIAPVADLIYSVECHGCGRFRWHGLHSAICSLAHRHVPSPDGHKILASFVEYMRGDPRFHQTIADMQRRMHEEFASINDRPGFPMKSTLTIRETSELTGRNRHAIRTP